MLELGGKDAAIIANDANLEQCIPIVLRGTFQNAGQNCIIKHFRIHLNRCWFRKTNCARGYL